MSARFSYLIQLKTEKTSSDAQLENVVGDETNRQATTQKRTVCSFRNTTDKMTRQHHHHHDLHQLLPIGSAADDPKSVSFVSDAGFVTHARYEATRGNTAFVIQPFYACSPSVQADAIAGCGALWPETASSASQIEQNRANADAFYVMATTSEHPGRQAFMGSVAVDRQRSYAFVSHLYVVPRLRDQGYGKLLMLFAEAYIARYGMTESRVWCDSKALVLFYTHLGYAIEATQQTDHGAVDVMVKAIIPDKLGSGTEAYHSLPFGTSLY